MLDARILMRGLGVSLAGMLCLGAIPPASAMQSKSFVVSWFTPAIWSTDGDCLGRNPSIDGIYRHAIRQLGVSREEEEQLFAKYEGTTGGDEAGRIIINRSVIGGKHVNAYANPTAAPDPMMFHVTGKIASGFNLDGKIGPNDFEEAQTHEKGIDNAFFRATGCHTGMRAYYPNRTHSGGTFQWDSIRQSQPAWLITVKGEDLGKDGPVKIVFDRALEATQWDALSQNRVNATYRVDSNPRSHNEFDGQIKGGVISTTAAGTFHMVSDPYYIHIFKFEKAQLRINILPNGNLDGLVGGYQPWIDPYQGLATGGLSLECCLGVDFIGLFYSLRKLADANPDPKTGENTHISTAYRIEAVPAYTVPDTVIADKLAERAK